MDYLHLTEDEEGVSRFEDAVLALAEGDFAPPAPAMPISAPAEATALRFLILPPGWTGARHPSPRRQIGLCLSGRFAVTAGSGETRTLGPGGIWLMADTAGSGHVTTVLGDEDVRLAIVQLGEGAVP
jgi:quercetin dioxygenase-like cupin family protein